MRNHLFFLIILLSILPLGASSQTFSDTIPDWESNETVINIMREYKEYRSDLWDTLVNRPHNAYDLIEAYRIDDSGLQRKVKKFILSKDHSNDDMVTFIQCVPEVAKDMGIRLLPRATVRAEWLVIAENVPSLRGEALSKWLMQESDNISPKDLRVIARLIKPGKW